MKMFNACNLDHEATLKTIEELSSILKRTYSPHGATSLIAKSGDSPRSTKDGFEVINQLTAYSAESEAILNLIKGVTASTLYTSGDGTTTSVLLVESLYRELLSLKQNEFKNKTSVEFNAIISDVISIISGILKEQGKKPSKEELLNLAYTSLNNDGSLTKYVREAFDKIGEDAFTLIAKLNVSSSEIETEVLSGYGVKTLEFGINENINTLISNVIVVSLDKIETDAGLTEMCKVAEWLMESKPNHKLLFIIPEISNWLHFNIEKLIQRQLSNEKLNVLFMEASRGGSVGESDAYDDMYAFLGTVPVKLHEENDGNFIIENIDKFSTVDVRPEETKTVIIMKNRSNQMIYNQRCKLLEQKANKSTGAEKNNYEFRYRKLTGKLAVIHVGAKTVAERNRLYQAFEDATLAIKFAEEYGVTGGMNLTIPRLLSYKPTMMDAEYSIVSEKIYNAYISLFNTIMEIAKIDGDTAAEKLNELLKMDNMTTYDVKNRMFTDKIINTIKAEMEILTASYEIVSVLLNSNQIIFDSVGIANAYEHNCGKLEEFLEK